MGEIGPTGGLALLFYPFTLIPNRFDRSRRGQLKQPVPSSLRQDTDHRRQVINNSGAPSCSHSQVSLKGGAREAIKGRFCKSLHIQVLSRDTRGNQLQLKGGHWQFGTLLFRKSPRSLPASKLASGKGREVGDAREKPQGKNGSISKHLGPQINDVRHSCTLESLEALLKISTTSQPYLR